MDTLCGTCNSFSMQNYFVFDFQFIGRNKYYSDSNIINWLFSTAENDNFSHLDFHCQKNKIKWNKIGQSFDLLQNAFSQSFFIHSYICALPFRSIFHWKNDVQNLYFKWMVRCLFFLPLSVYLLRTTSRPYSIAVFSLFNLTHQLNATLLNYTINSELFIINGFRDLYEMKRKIEKKVDILVDRLGK